MSFLFRGEFVCRKNRQSCPMCGFPLSTGAHIQTHSLFKILIYPALYNIYTGRVCTCSTEKNIRLLGEMFVCCVAAPYLCIEEENKKMHVWRPVAGDVRYMIWIFVDSAVLFKRRRRRGMSTVGGGKVDMVFEKRGYVVHGVVPSPAACVVNGLAYIAWIHITEPKQKIICSNK